MYKMKLMKKIAVLLAFLLLFAAFAACAQRGGDKDGEAAAETATTKAPTTQAPTTTQAATTKAADTKESTTKAAEPEKTTASTTAAETATTTAAEPAPAAGQPKRVNLEFMAPCPVSQINDIDAVWEEVYRRTDDFLNVRVNYTFTGFDDIGQRVSLRIAAGEALDGAFTAQWISPSMQDSISQGLFFNLDEFFNNDAYPGLKKAFSGDFLASNMFPDKNGVKHVYAIPFNNATGGNALYYRKDLADKYGLPDIKDYETLTKYFDAILANEPGMIPFCHIGTVDFLSEYIKNYYRSVPDMGPHNQIRVSVTGGHDVDFFCVIGDDGTAYAARHFLPTMDPKYASMVKGAFADEEPLLYINLARDWYEKGYVSKDIMNESDFEGEFMAGKGAAYTRGLNTYTAINNRLNASIPGAKLGAWVISPNYRFDTSKAEGSSFQAWNFLAVPVTSPNLDRIITLMNWIFEDRANHDLVELGIEGKHWVAVGDDKYEYPPGTNPETNYNFNGYVLTWNPTMQRYYADTPDYIVDAMNKCGDPQYLYRTPDVGFGFVQDPVEMEIIGLNDVGAHCRALANGVIENIPAEVERIQIMLDDVGFQNVAAEVERQVNEFLKANPYQGQ